MHVLYTVHRFWPAVGGTELALMDLAQEITKLGHKVTIATSDEPGSPEREVVKGIDVRRFAMRRAGKFRFPPKDYVRFVLDGPWDVVHVKGQRVWSSDYLFNAVPKIRQPKVFTAHGFHQWHMYRHDPFELWYYRSFIPSSLNKFDRVIALTGNEVDEMIQFGVDPQRIVHIPDGVNLTEYERAPPPGFRKKHGVTKRHMLLYAGGFYDNKRVDFLIRAVAKMKTQDLELVVVGKDSSGGPMRAEGERLAKELGAPVRVLGQIPREELVQAFFEADLFLLGAKFEGFGIVLLETMAAGVPFVSTPAGAAPDLAELGGGRIARTPEEMARKADALLADPGLRSRMGAMGREAAMKQTISWAADRHEELYRSLL